MKFRTEITLKPYSFRLNYHSKIFGLGSCFVGHLKQKFEYYQFEHLINDFGVVFNPHSILTLLNRIVHQNFYTPDDFFYFQNQWKNFELHSSLNHISQEDILLTVNNRLKNNLNFLKKTDLAIFTFGSSWVYRHKKSQKIVSNCHKVPQQQFDKILLSINEIVDIIGEIISILQQTNKQIKILFTVSPVRHLKDGFIENQQSKAHLIASLHHFNQTDNVFYFPSYEIMMDDLRDYRFYTKDLLHPNELAVEYIWEKFKKVLIHNEIYDDMKMVDKIRKSLQHKPFEKDSIAYQQHLQKTKQLISLFRKKYPKMKF